MASTANAVSDLARVMTRAHVAQAFEMDVDAVNADGTVNIHNGTTAPLSQVPVVGGAPVVGQRVLYLVYDKRGVVIGGSTGAMGPQGPVGPQGPKGDTGAQGPQGPAGTGAVYAAISRSGNQFNAGLANAEFDLPFENAITNVGGFTVTSNYLFGVPRAGTYLVNAQGKFRSGGTVINCTFGVKRNGAAVLSVVYEKTASMNDVFLNLPVAVTCNAGDTLSAFAMASSAPPIQLQGILMTITLVST